MNLKHSTDFWQFYLENQTDVEKILWHVCWAHRNTIDPEDLHTELLVRLQRSQMLTEYDPSKSSLNTYLTQRVWGYTSYIIKKERDFIDPLVHGHPCSSHHQDECDFNGDMNMVLADFNVDINEQFIVDTILENLKLKCTDSQWELIRLRLQGLSIREIHETGKFNCSQQRVNHEWVALKGWIIKECQKQGVLANV